MEVSLNIRKILLASLIYPIVYPRAVLNALTLPIFMLICNWAIATSLGAEDTFWAWFGYVFQFYALSVYLTNCFLLVTTNEVPRFFQHQSVYAKCCLLLTGYTFLIFAVKYYFVMLGLNIFGVSGPEAFSQLDEMMQLLARVLLFNLFFVIPHYIYTGKVSVKVVLRHTRRYFIGLTLIIVIVEMFKIALDYLVSGAISTPVILVASMVLLIFQGIEYIVIAFCYQSIFSKKSH